MLEVERIRERRRARRMLNLVKGFLERPGPWKFFYGDLRKKAQLGRLLEVSRDLAGTVEDSVKGIFVDFRHDVIPTIVHECLHVMRPDWSERTVLRWEARISKHMTARDAIDIHRLFSRRLPR